jgi:hypothetical protein
VPPEHLFDTRMQVGADEAGTCVSVHIRARAQCEGLAIVCKALLYSFWRLASAFVYSYFLNLATHGARHCEMPDRSRAMHREMIGELQYERNSGPLTDYRCAAAINPWCCGLGKLLFTTWWSGGLEG